jgi:hypothetical protein
MFYTECGGESVMYCRKCGKSIPDSALRCPYCDAPTVNLLKKEGKKLIEPLTDLFKKNPYKRK